MKTFRFSTQHIVLGGYVDISATSERKAIALFKQHYRHLTLSGNGGKLFRLPYVVG